MNTLLVMFFIIAFAFYIFYKVKKFRSNGPAEKRWLQTKVNISLGLFIGLFGLNMLIGPSNWVGIVVGIVFLALGAANVLYGYKAYKHYLPYVMDETNEQNNART
ncbi:YtpI family protein [Staphylococcus aureus]|uniref:YtpI family protein n=1 Tax=Staphylococcus aureus TaxID=1280 RepID=UPI000B7E2E1E|nr:YtpI family protein [Staphylococcus aureus]